jgi:hypothetical protein
VPKKLPLEWALLKPIQELKNKSDDDTDIFQHNIIDYYRDRPLALENYSFFRFASWYAKVSEPKEKNNKVFLPTLQSMVS